MALAHKTSTNQGAILRSALQEEEWELGHLAGRELVADSFTKVVDGPAFERALQDLCIKADCDVKKVHGGGSHNSINARVAMLVGATLLSSAAATTEEVGEDELPWFWTVGLILMCVGAVYVGSLGVRSGMWLGIDCRGHRAANRSMRPKGKMRHLESACCDAAVVKRSVSDEQQDVQRSTKNGPPTFRQLTWKSSESWWHRVAELRMIHTTKCMVVLWRIGTKMSLHRCHEEGETNHRKNLWTLMRRKL